MSAVRRNIVANTVGKLWTALVSLAVVPVYIHFLGIEAYGLIGVFLSLISIFSIFDLGLGTALNRELARFSAQHGQGKKMRDLLRTFEIIYWLIGIFIGAGIAALAPLIAGHWLIPRNLSIETVTHAFVLMGIVFACQWPRSLYSGGLSGMQRQVVLNVVQVVTITALNIGGVVTVWLVSPTIEALLVWYILGAVAESALTGILLWKTLPALAGWSGFRLSLLRSVWRFAAGMTGITVTGALLTQLDKIVLSKLLPLDAFGYYSLAWRVAQGLYYLISPITAAFFPRFSQLAAVNDDAGLAQTFHRACQLMSIVVLPVTVVLVLWPHEVLLLWTRSEEIAAATGALLAPLIAGTALNGLMTLPLAVQLARDRTRLVVMVNAAAVVVMIPALYVAAARYGALGAAWLWLGLNLAYVVLLLPMMARSWTAGCLREWFIRDVGASLTAVLIVALAWHQLVGLSDSVLGMGGSLVAAILLTTLASIAASPLARAVLARHYAHRMASPGGV